MDTTDWRMNDTEPYIASANLARIVEQQIAN